MKCWIKTVPLALALLFAPGPTARAEEGEPARLYAALLARVMEDGRVNYAELAASRTDLARCLDAYAAVTEREFGGWTVPERLAFLINVYNLTVLDIVAGDYPLASIRKAGGWFSGDPFEWPRVRLFGYTISLEILLRNYIRRDYAEPGVHFALCQGALGSPPLREEPYEGARLDAQLADQARRWLSATPHNRIDKERRRLYLSPVFRWYAADFERRAGRVEAYVRMVTPEEWGVRDLPGRFAIRYTDFDWRLNDARPSQK